MKNFLLISTLLLSFLLGCESKKSTKSSIDFLETSSMENEGLAQEPINVLVDEISSGTYGYIDKLLIAKNGKIVLNQSFAYDYEQISQGKIGLLGCGFNTCEDSTIFNEFNYYHPYWHPYYKNKEVHTLQSVTKSISSILIGIAIDQGHIPSIDTKLVEYLSNYDLSHVDEAFKNTTLENLLTMRLGMEWYEIGSSDSTNTTFALERSNNWLQFILNQPMDTIPGTKWIYNSGGSQLMSVLVKETTGSYLDEFADKFLFKPLGIQNYHWKKSPDGFPDALGGLYLEVEDLAKIGQLMLNGGNWNGQQLVSSEWVKQSTSKISDSTQVEDYGYGFQWWRPDQNSIDVWAGFGFGGQILFILPEFEMVVVIYSWNIFDNEFHEIRKEIVSVIEKSIKKNR